MSKGSLIVIGTGISVGHLTMEAPAGSRPPRKSFIALRTPQPSG